MEFTGRESHHLQIQWSKNGRTLEDGDPRVRNSLDEVLASGSTVLSLSPARRSDSGVYHVVISSQVGVVEGEPPAFTSQAEASFQIDVTGKGMVNDVVWCCGDMAGCTDSVVSSGKNHKMIRWASHGLRFGEVSCTLEPVD